MTSPLRLGMLTPSSNTVLEPLTAAMLAALPGASAHFARFRVVAIDLGEGSRSQFDLSPVVAAAELLADAKVHAICWNGTSGSWLGLEQDRGALRRDHRPHRHPGDHRDARPDARLRGARRQADRPGDALPRRGAAGDRRPLGRSRADCVAERHLEDPGNYSFAEHSEATVARLVREVAAARPEAIAIHCTNFRGGGIAAALEAELGIPVLDSVAVSLWGAIGAAGASAAPLAAQGRVFALPW